MTRWFAGGRCGRRCGWAISRRSRETCPRRKPRIVPPPRSSKSLAKQDPSNAGHPPRPGARPSGTGCPAQGRQSLSGRRSQAARGDPAARRDRQAAGCERGRPAGPGREPLPAWGPAGSPRGRHARGPRGVSRGARGSRGAGEAIRRSPRVPDPAGPISEQPRDAAKGSRRAVRNPKRRCERRSTCWPRRSKAPIRCPGRDGKSLGVSNNLGSLLLLTEARPTRRARSFVGAEGLLRTLAAEFPAVPQYPLELASVEYNLGLLAAKTRHPDQAVASFKESARLLEELKTSLSGNARLPNEAGGLASRPRRSPCRNHPGGSRRLAQKGPGRAVGTPDANTRTFRNTRLAAGRGHYQLGLLLVKSKPAEAVRRGRKGQGAAQEVLKTRPDSELALRYLLENQVLLGQALIAAGRLAGRDGRGRAKCPRSVRPIPGFT